jgi:hypothetical protein
LLVEICDFGGLSSKGLVNAADSIMVTFVLDRAQPQQFELQGQELGIPFGRACFTFLFDRGIRSRIKNDPNCFEPGETSIVNL